MMTEAIARQRPLPSFWLLDGRTGWGDRRGWGTLHRRRVSESSGVGLRVAFDPEGPLGLDGERDAPGGLTLPRGFVFDEAWTLYLLSPERPSRILKFDPEAEDHFTALPGIGEEGSEPGEFREPRQIAIACGALYVADTANAQVQRIDLTSLEAGVLPAPTGHFAGYGKPIDLAVRNGTLLVLYEAPNGVLGWDAESEDWHEVVPPPTAADGRRRLLIDRQGWIYLHHPQKAVLEVIMSDGTPPPRRDAREVAEPGDLTHRFAAPPIRLDHKGRFVLPGTLAALCNRRPPANPPAADDPLALLGSEGALLFDRRGRRLAPSREPEALGPKFYVHDLALVPLWIVGPLDSGLYDCQWHRIELEGTRLPPGAALSVETYTDNMELDCGDIEALSPKSWDQGYTALGSTEPPAGPNEARAPHEFLVQSAEGQYLWLKLQLSSNGYSTPVVRRIRVHYPRQSYLEYLPAVYAADPQSRHFLEQFLSVFQTEWDTLEHRLQGYARQLEPTGVSAGPFMDYLASWLGLPLEPEWKGEQRRNLLDAAPKIYQRRGTVEGLRAYLRVYLQNIRGIAPNQQLGFPQILEGFRERRRVRLGCDGGPEGSGPAPLWGPAEVGRLQLDVYAREGEARLISTKDPDRDLFHKYAHCFQVFVPAAWICTKREEAMLRQALDMEKPAHTQYRLCLVEPGFRLGIQSTLDYDTILDGPPSIRLTCEHDRVAAPPSSKPRPLLGDDTLRPPAGVVNARSGRPAH